MASEHDHALLIRLRGADHPIAVEQESEAAAQASLAYLAVNWLRLPPEARPASCWLITRDAVIPTVDEEGVGEQKHIGVRAVVDPREIQGAYIVKVKRKEAWE